MVFLCATKVPSYSPTVRTHLLQAKRRRDFNRLVARSGSIIWYSKSAQNITMEQNFLASGSHIITSIFHWMYTVSPPVSYNTSKMRTPISSCSFLGHWFNIGCVHDIICLVQYYTRTCYDQHMSTVCVEEFRNTMYPISTRWTITPSR